MVWIGRDLKDQPQHLPEEVRFFKFPNRVSQMNILHYMIDHKDQINLEKVFVAVTTVGLCKVGYSKLDRQ